jgi:hypothetical protein
VVGNFYSADGFGVGDVDGRYLLPVGAYVALEYALVVLSLKLSRKIRFYLGDKIGLALVAARQNKNRQNKKDTHRFQKLFCHKAPPVFDKVYVFLFGKINN